MLLSYTEICELIEQEVIQGAEYENVNSASLDIRLGKMINMEHEGYPASIRTISLKDKDPITVYQRSIENNPFVLVPKQFVLAQSHEIFNLPNNISAEYKLKSSMARVGLEHLNAGWCDAGWNGSVLTLELKNMTQYHRIVLTYMDKIGQIVFFKHAPVPEDKSYAVRGRYNGDKETTGAKR